MFRDRDWVIPALITLAIVIFVIAATQLVRFDCVDLGFYKSCGLSTVK